MYIMYIMYYVYYVYYVLCILCILCIMYIMYIMYYVYYVYYVLCILCIWLILGASFSVTPCLLFGIPEKKHIKLMKSKTRNAKPASVLISNTLEFGWYSISRAKAFSPSTRPPRASRPAPAKKSTKSYWFWKSKLSNQETIRMQAINTCPQIWG